MKILIEFYLKKKFNQNDKFLFWSCVLYSVIDDNSKSLEHNLNHEINIEEINSTLILFLSYREFNEEELKLEPYKNYQKRPTVFLACNETTLKGSPYHNASSKLTNYYQSVDAFVENLKKFCGFENDFEFNEFQKNIISKIEDDIGINIINNSSIPGCLSIYDKLDSFIVDGNFNERNGKERYVIVSSENYKKYENAFIEIEIFDEDNENNKKILFKQIYPYNNEKYKLPDIDKLEGFGCFCITIFNNGELIFEEKFYLIRDINFSTHILGNTTKLLRNRYKNNNVDSFAAGITNKYSKIFKDKDFYDIESEYKNKLYGKNKKYLEAHFFDNTDIGRKAFLAWVRKKVSNSNNITIIDPYFDNNAVNDLSACLTSILDITIVTTKPDDLNRDNTENLLSNIFENFGIKTKVYYLNKNKIHDRYVLFDDVMFSMSNSWNGTVNNYSLFVQELSLEIALQVDKELNDYIIDDNKQILSVQDKEKVDIDNKGEKYTKEYLIKLLKKLKNYKINSFFSNKKLICIAREIFRCDYYGNAKEIEFVSIINNKIKNIDDKNIKNIVGIIIDKLLRKQKDTFIKNKQFIEEKKSLADYDSIQEMLKLINNRIRNPIRSYTLEIDYSLCRFLEILFLCYPITVIKILEEKEKEICFIEYNDRNDKKTLNYRMSEILVSYFLTKYFYFIKALSDEKVTGFIEKVSENLFCKIFLLKLFLNNNRILEFNYIIDVLKNKFGCSSEEILMILINIYEKGNKKSKINDEILLYIRDNYKAQDLIKAIDGIFLDSYEIDFKTLGDFVGKIEDECDKKNIEDFLLIKAMSVNFALQRKIIDIISPEECIKKIIQAEIDTKKQIADADIYIRKYRNILNYVGEIFATRINNLKKEKDFKSLKNNLKLDKYLIFEVHKYPEKINLFYYESVFLLHTLKNIEKKDDLKNLLLLLEWYLPLCLNRQLYEFSNLDIELFDLYLSMLEDEQKLKLVSSLKCNANIMMVNSSIKQQDGDKIKKYEMFFQNYEFEPNDNNRSIIIVLNIFVNLCIRCGEKENAILMNDLLKIVELIISKSKTMSENGQILLNAGVTYAKNSSKDNKKVFIDAMEKAYFPYVARSFMEKINENL